MQLYDFAGGIIESVVYMEPPEPSLITVAGVDFVGLEAYRPRLTVIELLQTHAAWTDVTSEAVRISTDPRFDLFTDQTTILFDLTNAVASMAEGLHDAAGDSPALVYPVILGTETAQAYRRGIYYVPRKDVVLATIAAVQSGELQISEELELAVALQTALHDVSLRAATEIAPLALAAGLCSWMAADMTMDVIEGAASTPRSKEIYPELWD